MGYVKKDSKGSFMTQKNGIKVYLKPPGSGFVPIYHNQPKALQNALVQSSQQKALNSKLV